LGDADGVTASNGVNNIGGVANNTAGRLTSLNANVSRSITYGPHTKSTQLINDTVAYANSGVRHISPTIRFRLNRRFNIAQITLDASADGALGATATAVLAAINAGDLIAELAVKPLTIDVATDTTTAMCN